MNSGSRAVFSTLRRRAAWAGVVGGRSGAVVILQRFGGALNLNVHIHGQRVARLGEPGDPDDPLDGSTVRCHARSDGFDLDATDAVPAGARARLERLCRYVLRPAVVSERLQRGDDGPVIWRLPRP